MGPVLCPVCKEKKTDTAMNQVGKDSRYFYYRCPVCKNETMVALESYTQDKAYDHLYDLSESMA